MDHHRLRDKLSYENPRVSGADQVDCDRTGKMSRRFSGKWASAGTRLKRLRRTGGAGGIVLPNASLTRDEPRTYYKHGKQKKIRNPRVADFGSKRAKIKVVDII